MILYSQQYKQKTNRLALKEKLTPPSLKSREESVINQNSFRVLSILSITNFYETRKINSNPIRALFLLLNFQKVGSTH